MANVNFRITTNYVFQVINVYDNNYYTVWISGVDNPVLNIASTPDTTSTALDWDYVVNSLPVPPASAADTTNYQISNEQQFYIINVDTGKWHLISIDGTESNPALLISSEGKEL